MNNNTDIKVSVVMPIYNAYDYLRPALDSILTQTLSEFEIICVDDGSTDPSLEMLKEYQSRDERIRIITETNAGPALARNNGMRRARGEYVAFLDADDFLEPTFLEKLYTIAKRDDLDIAISEYDVYNTKKARFEKAAAEDSSYIFVPDAVTSKSEHPDCIFSSTVSSAWNKLFRREFLEEKNLSFLIDVRMFEDVYFVLTALSLAERVGKTFEVLMHHRIHSEQARAKMFGKYYSHIPRVYEKVKEFLMQHGMYAPLCVSYLNYSATRCYKLFNLLSHDSKESFWNLLNSQYAKKLGFADENLLDIADAPARAFIANVVRYDYEQYKRRCMKGKEEAVIKVSGEKTTKNGRGSFIKKLFSKKQQ